MTYKFNLDITQEGENITKKRHSFFPFNTLASDLGYSTQLTGVKHNLELVLPVRDCESQLRSARDMKSWENISLTTAVL